MQVTEMDIMQHLSENSRWPFVYLGHSSTQLQGVKVYFKPVVEFFNFGNNILQQIKPHLQLKKV